MFKTEREGKGGCIEGEKEKRGENITNAALALLRSSSSFSRLHTPTPDAQPKRKGAAAVAPTATTKPAAATQRRSLFSSATATAAVLAGAALITLPAFTGTRLGAFLKILPKNPRVSLGWKSASVPDVGSGSSSSSSISSARFVLVTGVVLSASSARAPLSLRDSTSCLACSICSSTTSSDATRPLDASAERGTSTLISVVVVVTPETRSVARVWKMETPFEVAPERADLGDLGVGVLAAGDATRARLLRGLTAGDCRTCQLHERAERQDELTSASDVGAAASSSNVDWNAIRSSANLIIAYSLARR